MFAGKPLTSWLFVVMTLVYLLAFLMDLLPFPVLAVLFLVNWCVLAMVCLAWQRRQARRRIR